MRHGWLLVLSLVITVYLVINLALPLVPIDPLIRSYVLQPLVWGLLILSFLFLPAWKPFARTSTWRTFIWLGLAIAFAQIFLYFIGGLFTGFGKNPSSITPLGITENLFFVGTMIVGMELGRTWLVTNLGKRHSFLALALVTILFTIVAIPLSQLTGFKFEVNSINLVTSSWVPLLAESLLASLLAMIAGARASIAYRGLLAAFWWLCPVLPDLSWGLKALIGAAVPIIGIMVVNSFFTERVSRIKSKRKVRKSYFPAGWIFASLCCVVLVWFVVGVFPFQPELVGSGSMTPVLRTGDVVIVAKVPASAVRVGDIIEYRKDENTNIVHRVINIDNSSGTETFTTKGDANSAEDENPVLAQNVVGKVVFDIPKVGWISIAIKQFFGQQP